MKNTVAFCTLGCKVNQYETDAMRELFTAAGYTTVQFSEQADIYVVNTCTVTNIADRKSRQMLHRAKKHNPESLVVAVGCYVQAAGEAVEADPLVDIVVGNNMKSDIVSIVETYRAGNSQAQNEYMVDMDHALDYETLEISKVSEHTRAYIKIQDGCNQFCSYCIIPYARGRVRSREITDIVAEVTRLAEHGYKEVVLTGIHISSYGLDFKQKTQQSQDAHVTEDYHPFDSQALLSLIDAISGVTGIERIRLGSLEPRIMTEAFVAHLAGVKKMCPHFHLSLQSGCDRTLKQMNRHYTAGEYMEKCRLLRQYFDRPAITTDIIAGFPGETEADFEETFDFVRAIHFAELHVFKYSRRQGTRAADMPAQVGENIKAVRSERLIEEGRRQRNRYIEACQDKVLEVLIEEATEIDGRQFMTGHSREYIRCLCEAAAEPNTIMKVKIASQFNEEFVLCKRID